MLTIQPQYLPLTKLLDGRLFQIPEYQRAYSWTSHERQDLFNDIKKTHAKGTDEGHCMAAVVCLRRRTQLLGTDEFHVVEVVDGQQRLTTLIILLKSIELALDPNNKTDGKLAIELRELLVKVEGDELLLLQTNHDSSHYFATFLRKGTAPSSEQAKTLADREILRAIEDASDFIEEWRAAGHSLASLAALLKNRLHFLLHEIEDEKSVYTVFEVLNSRGLDVSWMDRLKSILMGASFELKGANQKGLVTDLHNVWRDVYTVIGLRQGLSTEALRFAATLYAEEAPSRPLGEQDAVIRDVPWIKIPISHLGGRLVKFGRGGLPFRQGGGGGRVMLLRGHEFQGTRWGAVVALGLHGPAGGRVGIAGQVGRGGLGRSGEGDDAVAAVHIAEFEFGERQFAFEHFDGHESLLGMGDLRFRI